MEKEFLLEYINEDMSLNDISLKTNKSKTTIRYWLKKYNLKTNHKSFKEIGVIDYGEQKYCPKCDKDKPIEDFYNRRGKTNGSVYCKSCTKEQTILRQRKLKQLAIDYKGGKCEKCGYNKCNSALEFHHINPKEKDFSISKLKRYSFSNKIKKELDKCMLLCANCHREIHNENLEF